SSPRRRAGHALTEFLEQLGPEPRQLRDLPRGERLFEIGDAVHLELVVKQLDALGAEAGNAQQLEQSGWDRGDQLLALWQGTGLDEGRDFFGDAAADAGQVGEIELAAFDQLGERIGMIGDRPRGVAIGAYAEWIGGGDLEEIGHLAQETGNLGVLHIESSPLTGVFSSDTLAVPKRCSSYPVGGRSMVRKVLGLVLLAVAFPLVLAAQSQATTGIIRGTVVDPSGAPATNATVVLRETQTGFERQTGTNERGIFVASLLPLGTYDVSARAVGFTETRQTGIRLGVGGTINLTLQLQAVQLQAVTVEATQPVVDATRIETSTSLPDAAVSRLPNNGRNYLNLTLLTPNVAIVQGPDGDELSIGGQK